ncbi:MAG: DUF4249 domain-containing protein [Sphingobacteriaceae bacterium]|nr:DUF4249 domain-containing protein [Sphingobacteriaceae bacterium]
MRNDSYRLIYVIVMLFLAACKERFEPAIDTPLTGYLVVEGNINSGMGPTVIKLSRTGKLNFGGRAENEAEVQILGEDLSSYALAGNGNGVYTSAVLNLPKQRYQLRIKTGGKEYLTELLEEKQTPPIDSVSWQRDPDGVRIYVHTHDDANKAKYYKWTFDETWEIHSDYFSSYGFKTTPRPNGRSVTTVFKRTQQEEEMMFYCWKSEASNQILLGSTAKLAKDIITAPVQLIRNNDERLVYLYSINVVQTALDMESYNFYKNLKDNTESNGSIFDRQPSEIDGNIRCVTDPGELVIGNVMLTSPQEKRIFIYGLPNWRNPFACDPTILEMFHNPDTLKKYNGPHVNLPMEVAAANTPLHPDSALKYTAGKAPIAPLYAVGISAPNYIIGYELASRRCVDCTVRGSNIKPLFWPQ